MDVEQLEQREIRRKQILVASLFLLAGACALLFAYWMGAFGIGPTRQIYVNYDFAGGLDRGSPVRLAGIKVGRVSEINFVNTPTVIKLKIEISRDAFVQITEDSKFYINLAGLIGERYVEVVPGNGAQAKNNHEFRGIDPPRVDQLISQGYGIFGDLRTLFNENKGDIKEMLASVNELAKNLNKLFSGASPDQRKQLSILLQNFASMSNDMREVMASVRSGASFIQNNGGAESWTHMRSMLSKGDSIGLVDIRRLMMEDGMKVNFTTRRVEAPSK
ncbi:MAG: MCE family protein [Bdellovibrionales bacterium]|nr:MCE family protein [Bdellovibrionales bacterium]